MPFTKDKKLSMYKPDMDHGPGMNHGPDKMHGPGDYHDDKPAKMKDKKSIGLRKLAEANPDKLKYIGPTMSGGGPHPNKMGYAEKFSPENFSEKTKAMMYRVSKHHGGPGKYHN